LAAIHAPPSIAGRFPRPPSAIDRPLSAVRSP
jgi:hypothetical protein